MAKKAVESACYCCQTYVGSKLSKGKIPLCTLCWDRFIGHAKKTEETQKSDFVDEDTPVMWGGD